MTDKPESLWLHAYSGREHGLMVIGTPNAIKALGETLMTASDSALGEATDRWPREVAAPVIIGPYKDIPDFSLSFHVQGTAPLSEVAPLTRRSLPTPLFFGVAVCTVIGAVTLIRWVLNYVF